MKVHHNTAKKAKKVGITLEIVENDIVASKDGVTLASGMAGNKVLDDAIAKLDAANPHKKAAKGLIARATKAIKKAVGRKTCDEEDDGQDDELSDEECGLGDDEDKSRSVVKAKYKAKYRPFKMTNGDDIAQQIHEHVMYKNEETKLRMNYAKFMRFAKANSCWDPAYSKLNNGLQRMNVVNRLRGKVRRDKHKIVWPA